MADFGYDVSDYCDIDPVFGTLDDYDRLLRSAHEHDIRLTIDWVPNHTSNQHPWFVDAQSSTDSAKRDWYVWRDPAPGGGEPNNWEACWQIGPAWTFDEASGQYYLHLFLPEQPDLNWSNPQVADAMLDTLRFWLDRGTDGFRADVVHLIGKDPALPDLPKYGTPIARIDEPATHDHLRRIRALLDSYPQHPMIVGEVNLYQPGQVLKYYGDDDELNLTFNFRPIRTPWDPAAFRERITEVHDELGTDHWPVWVLNNHDQPRLRTRVERDARARAAAVLLLGLRGTPYLYAGEELGLPTPTSRRIASSTPAAATGAGHRSRGLATTAMAGGPTPGCRSSTTPASVRSRPSATIPARPSTSTGRCSRSVVRLPHSAVAESDSSTHPKAWWPGVAAATATTSSSWSISATSPSPWATSATA